MGDLRKGDRLVGSRLTGNWHPWVTINEAIVMLTVGDNVKRGFYSSKIFLRRGCNLTFNNARSIRFDNRGERGLGVLGFCIVRILGRA